MFSKPGGYFLFLINWGLKYSQNQNLYPLKVKFKQYLRKKKGGAESMPEIALYNYCSN